MSITMGVIDCISEDFNEISQLFDRWLSSLEVYSHINHHNVKIVNSSYDNYYGGIKVGFFADIKHDYYGMVFKSLIENFESLLNALPFDRAILYHDGSGNMTQWFLNTPKNIEMYGENDGIVEHTKYPHICRITNGDWSELKSMPLLTASR